MKQYVENADLLQCKIFCMQVGQFHKVKLKGFHHMLGAFDVGILNVGLWILKCSTLLSFHRVLHERGSMKGNKVVKFIHNI